MGRLLVAGLLASSLWGQEQEEVIRTSTRLVEINVIVRDKKGPVAGLTKDDFTVQDEGKRQTIAVFSVVSANGSASTGPVTAVPPAGRDSLPTATILLIDRLNTPVASQVYANQRIIKFLQTRQKKDPVGIFALGRSLQMVQGLTRDTDRLERVVKGLKAQDGRRIAADVTAEPTGDSITDGMISHSLEELQDFVVTDRSRTTTDALLAIAQQLKNTPGRKNLIWVSGSFPLLIVEPHKTLNFSDEIARAGRALTDANIAVYPVDARGLGGASFLTAEQSGQPAGSCLKTGEPCLPPPGRGGPSGIDTMNTLADLTGGRAFYNTNGIEDSIQQAVDDAEITYTLGFYPGDEPDNSFHRLTVKVTGKGRNVRFRRGYYATKQ